MDSGKWTVLKISEPTTAVEEPPRLYLLLGEKDVAQRQDEGGESERRRRRNDNVSDIIAAPEPLLEVSRARATDEADRNDKISKSIEASEESPRHFAPVPLRLAPLILFFRRHEDPIAGGKTTFPPRGR